MPRVRAWHLWMWVTGPLHSSFFWCAKRVRYDETVIRHDYLPDSGAPRGGLTAPLTAMVEVVLCWPPRHCGSVPSSVLIARYFGSLRVRLRLRVRSVIVQRIGSGPSTHAAVLRMCVRPPHPRTGHRHRPIHPIGGRLRAIFKEDRDVPGARARLNDAFNEPILSARYAIGWGARLSLKTDNRATGGPGPATGPPTRLQHSRKLPI